MHPSFHIHRLRRGLTLVEVMVGFTLAAIAFACIFALLLQTYRVTLHTRYLDESRSVLRSMAEQVMHPNANTLLLQATTTPTGTGLSWGAVNGAATGLPVTIGGAGNLPITALVTREVSELDEASAATNSVTTTGAAGRLIQCRLTINFTRGTRLTQTSLTLIRSVP
jgi:hypothetical protein